MTKTINVGIDDVARGSLAGPMIFCLLSHNDGSWLINNGAKDSKITTEAARSNFYRFMKQEQREARAVWTYVVIQPAELDRLGYTKAVEIYLSEAIFDFRAKSGMNLNIKMDGSEFPLSIPQNSKISFVPRGDQTQALIAGASMLAKELHDRHMGYLDQEYPDWGFDSNKGYYTEQHLKQIYRLGLTTQHRVKPSLTAVTTYYEKAHLEPPSWLSEKEK